MKFPFTKAMLILSAAALTWNCSDSSSGSDPVELSSSRAAAPVLDPNATIVAPSPVGNIYSDLSVRDEAGNVVGTFDPNTTYITLNDGSVIDLNGNVISAPTSSSSEIVAPTSSASVDPMSSAILPTSSAAVEVSSSSINITPVDPNSGFKDISEYPVAAYKNISGNGTRGWNTRYWDACKPHCSWIAKGEEGKTDTTTQESYEKGMTTARNCNINDVEVPTFTLSHDVQQYWIGYEGTTSACESSAGAKGVFTCTDMAPIAVNDTLSYAYVAGPGSSTTCGKCFHLQYDGSFNDESSSNKPKETHKALKGKHIVVMTSNIGHDVKDGQFDLMVPGGGPGIFNALNIQVNGQNIEWGAQYGGFLTYCQGKLGYDASLEAYQSCVKTMCDDAFGNAGLPNLLRGCHWFADWYMAADNPTYQWEEVECPQYLLDHYLTTINTKKSNNYAWHTDWSTYKQGDELETLNCTDKGCECPDDMRAKGACK